MSSWRSGSAISRTAWSSVGISSAAAPTTTAASASRRRAAGDARLRRRDAASVAVRAMRAHDSLSLSRTADSAASSSSTVPELRPTKVARRAFSSWESWRAARSSTASWPRAARALGADVLVGDDRDRRVVDAVHAGLEQQRRLHHRGPRRRVGRQRLLAERRPRARRPAATAAPRATRARPARRTPWRRSRRGRRRRPGATSSPQRATTASTHLGGPVELVDDRVGRQRRRAEPLQRGAARSTCPSPSRRSARRTGRGRARHG